MSSEARRGGELLTPLSGIYKNLNLEDKVTSRTEVHSMPQIKDSSKLFTNLWGYKYRHFF